MKQNFVHVQPSRTHDLRVKQQATHGIESRSPSRLWEKKNALLTRHSQYAALGNTDTERREVYRALFRADVDEALTEEIRAATNGNLALGNPQFQMQNADALGRRVTRGVAGRPVNQRQMPDERQAGLV